MNNSYDLITAYDQVVKSDDYLPIKIIITKVYLHKHIGKKKLVKKLQLVTLLVIFKYHNLYAKMEFYLKWITYSKVTHKTIRNIDQYILHEKHYT